MNTNCQVKYEAIRETTRDGMCVVIELSNGRSHRVTGVFKTVGYNAWFTTGAGMLMVNMDDVIAVRMWRDEV